VRPADAGGASGLGNAVGGISGAVASAVITPVLAARLIRAGHESLPAAGGYARAWLGGAVLAAAGAALVAVLNASRKSTARGTGTDAASPLNARPPQDAGQGQAEPRLRSE